MDTTGQNLNKIVEDILVNDPLYRKRKIEKPLHEVKIWGERSIRHYCEFDRSEQTFVLSLTQESLFKLEKNPFYEVGSSRRNGHTENIVFHIEGRCSYCKQYYIDFLINIFSELPIVPFNYYIRKIGAYPPYEIKPDNDVLSYLNKEHQGYYKKALMNLSHSYGIGAFAYFRRITEEIIKKVIENIITLELPGHEKVSAALEEYKEKRSMSMLIDACTPQLPKAFQDIGDNPLRLLYETASVGIHELSDSEDDCLKKAQLTDTLLQFVIRQMNEEGGSIKRVRDVIKELRK